MEILLDFDGTCVKHEFPEIGEDIGAQRILRKLVDRRHQLILFTMRCDRPPDFIPVGGELGVGADAYLTAAVNWFAANNIPLYGVQKHPTQHNWTNSPKAYGQLIIDDTCLGIPLITPDTGRPFVDWVEVEVLLLKMGIL